MSLVRSLDAREAGSVGARELSKGVLLVLAFTALTALAGQVRVPLPFTPVPLTLQTIPVLLAGAALGRARGAASQLVLLGVGALGLPVFTGGSAGSVHLLGATGGYLIGFVGAAWLVGRLIHGRVRLGAVRVMASMLAGSALIHLFGFVHLSLYLGGSLGRALEFGTIPFLLGDLLKAVIAASILLAWQRWQKKEA